MSYAAKSRSGKEIFVELCEAIDAYAAEHHSEVPRTVEEIEALAFAAFSAAGEVVGNKDAAEGLAESARKRLAVPVADRTRIN
jgi:hypothetical protein